MNTPQRATTKGHGFIPGQQFMFHGGTIQKTPDAEGILVTIERDTYGGYRMVDASGKSVYSPGAAGKYWAAPVAAPEPQAEEAPEAQPATEPTVAAQAPQRATTKGHGFTAGQQVMFHGYSGRQAPRSEGILVTVERDAVSNGGYTLRGAEGILHLATGANGKYWAAPVAVTEPQAGETSTPEDLIPGIQEGEPTSARNVPHADLMDGDQVRVTGHLVVPDLADEWWTIVKISSDGFATIRNAGGAIRYILITDRLYVFERRDRAVTMPSPVDVHPGDVLELPSGRQVTVLELLPPGMDNATVWRYRVMANGKPGILTEYAVQSGGWRVIPAAWRPNDHPAARALARQIRTTRRAVARLVAEGGHDLDVVGAWERLDGLEEAYWIVTGRSVPPRAVDGLDMAGRPKVKG